ncbi:hypothetical protein BDN67DRAFT_827284 [Paxillus ammoniavirescens]|nr:hypothetical protein BDN67DRAFT_827284 [Paxillus ammoniavirescens]
MLLNTFFGISSNLVCVNLYYCQPILIPLSNSFSVTYDEVSRIPTLVQAGYVVALLIGTKIHDTRYGIGLLYISPLGDMVRCRGLILILVLSSTSLMIRAAVTENLHVFKVISFLIGFTPIWAIRYLGNNGHIIHGPHC